MNEMFLCFNFNVISGFPENATLSNGVFEQVIQKYPLQCCHYVVVKSTRLDDKKH